jgi:hypothetical protein
VVLQWDEELPQAVRALPPGPTVTARAISVGLRAADHRQFMSYVNGTLTGTTGASDTTNN